MIKKQIITIAGKPGSGKSTTSKGVAQALNFTHFSSGDFFRAIGQERNIDVYEANLTAETEKEIDYMVDQKLRDLGETGNHLVIDSRMAWHWMPYSFKVYLDLELETAAARIINGMDPARLAVEHIPTDPHEYATVLQKRLESEIRRYHSLYQVNPYDTSNYDLVVDTAINSPQAAMQMIVDSFQNWLP